MTDFNKALGEGVSRGQLGAALNYNRYDQFGGQKIGGLYIDGVLKEGGSVQGTHVASTIQNYEFGARRVTVDGRVFKYAKASNTITYTQFGVKFWALSSDGVEANLSQAQVAGDTSILIVDANGVANNELRGGYVIIHTDSGQFRGIIGNTPATAGATTTIYLDEPLSANVANATYTEVYPNPYANVYSGYALTDKYSSVAGMPTTPTTANNQYLWIQTWGPIFINPYSHIGNTPDTDVRVAVFDYEGAVNYEHDAKGFVADSVSHQQHAGFIINRQASGVSGPPLIMLTITPW